MKKSFMTRALATGLSFAMAFSLSAATNVTTASAAAKKASVTTFMKTDRKEVTEGKTVTTYMNSTATKKYRIKSHTESATAKKYISVVMTSSRKGLKISAKDGAVTAANLTKKGVYTKINFAPATSVAAVKKAAATKYVKLKVVVNAKPVEKLTMTAAATGVKKITVTFNKAVDTKTALTLTKGTAKPAVSETVWNEAGTEATINMAGKLTKGTYTVAATVGTDALTADAVVEKDETLTSFALVGNTLKAKDPANTTTASIEYKALNQYEEPMACSTVNVTIAPGTMSTIDVKYPTASSAGKATVTDIPTLYTIAGSEFNVVIVDTTTGVTLNTKAVYGASAKAAKAESAGLYNTAKSKIMDMTAGDKVADYVALFKVTDQYGDPYEVKKEDVNANGTVAPMISAVAASGITNVKVGAFSATADPLQTVDNVKYFAVPFVAVGTSTTAVAGDFSLTLVNSNIGIIGTPAYTVADSTLIASIDISADAIYAGQDNTMTYNVTDTKGNTITAYDTLKNITFSAGSDGGKLAWSKNADGTAKLTYTATGISSALKSSIESFTATANPVTSSTYLVKTFSLTKLAQRKAVEVVGVASDFVTSTDKQNKVITLKMEKLLIEDQYGNIFTADELKANKLVSSSSIYVSGAAVQQNTTDDAITDKWQASSAAVVQSTTGAALTGGVDLVSPATSSAITTSFSIRVYDNTTGKCSEGYTLKMNKVGTDSLKNITGLTIESINAGYKVSTDNATNWTANFTESSSATGAAITGSGIPVVVTGKVNGNKVYVDSAIAEANFNIPTLPKWNSAADAKTDKATLTVYVTTADGVVKVEKEFEVSNVPMNSTGQDKIVKNGSYATATVTGAESNSKSAKSDLVAGAYTVRDMYGQILAGTTDSTKFTLNVTKVIAPVTVNDVTTNTDVTKNASDYYTITKNGMNGAAIQVKSGSGAKVTVNVVIEGTDINYDVVVCESNS